MIYNASTVGELISILEQNFNVDTPLVDIFNVESFVSIESATIKDSITDEDIIACSLSIEEDVLDESDYNDDVECENDDDFDDDFDDDEEDN